MIVKRWPYCSVPLCLRWLIGLIKHLDIGDLYTCYIFKHMGRKEADSFSTLAVWQRLMLFDKAELRVYAGLLNSDPVS